MASVYSGLRSQSRALESTTERLLAELSYLSAKPEVNDNTGGGNDGNVQQSLQDVLQNRRDVIEQMERALEYESVNPESVSAITSKTMHLSRAREVLADHQREFVRIQNDIQHSRENANLLSSVRDDINQYKARQQQEQQQQQGVGGDDGYLLSERSRIDSSHSMTDSILAQAYATREEFGRQTQSLAHLNRRLLNSAGSLPGINTLIGKISSRKMRDSIIMACVLSFCMMGLFLLR